NAGNSPIGFRPESSRRSHMPSITPPSRMFRLLCSVLVAGMFISQVCAQSTKPLLRGRVLDPAGAPIAGARIKAVPEGRASESSTVSDQSGEFSLPLEPGGYTVKISAQGFLEASRTVTLKDTGSEVLEITMQIATQRDTVEVTDSSSYQAPLITT